MPGPSGKRLAFGVSAIGYRLLAIGYSRSVLWPENRPAHTRAEHDAEMTDAQPLSQQLFLGFNHIVVSIVRKPGVQPVTRFAGTTETDGIRQD